VSRLSTKLLILGASGRCGRLVTQEAVKRGFNVSILVRSNASDFNQPGVTVFNGSVLDYDTVESAVRGQDAVACCLGIRRRSSVNPWSKLLSPPDFMARSAPLIVRAMDSNQVDRLVAISAAGVGSSSTYPTKPVRRLLRMGHLETAYHDLESMEQVLANSDLDSLVVRPVTLVNYALKSEARIVNRYSLLSVVSRSAVARWILDAIQRPDRFEHRSETIG